MIKKLSIVVFLSSKIMFFAQVGINTSTPSASLDIVSKGNTNITKALEINNSAAKEMVTVLNNGNVGIGETFPTTLLHVKSTVNPAMRIVDGTEGAGKILTSDTNGNTSWQTLAVSAIPGTWGATVKNFTSYGTGIPANMSLYTNHTITLPPGKWMVHFGDMASLGDNAPNKNINTSDAELWCTGYLTDSATSSTVTIDYIASYGGQRGSGGSIGRGMNRTFVNGAVAIDNSSSGNKTYYLWANQELETYNSSTTQISLNGGTIAGYWVSVFGFNWERYFYAIPIQ